MIWKSILVTIILLVFYTAFVSKFAPIWWHTSQHQWQENVIKAQSYLYDDSNTIKNVIVGSSLSCKINCDSIPNTYNLAFNSQTVFDGLSLIDKKAQLPKTVFIEMNVILGKPNEDFISYLTTPVLLYSKKVLPALREDRQPISNIGVKVKNRITQPLIIGFRRMVDALFSENPIGEKTPVSKNVEQEGNKAFIQLLNIQKDYYSKEPNKQVVDDNFKVLKAYISKLEKSEVNVIFFEMPVNNDLKGQRLAVKVRDTFHKNFPVIKYKYISGPENVSFKTIDGVHLTKDEAIAYTSFFKSQVQTYID